MKINIKKNLASGIFSIVFAVAMLISMPYCIKMKIVQVSSAVGPDYLPKIMAWVMLICGVLLVGKSLILKKDEKITLELRGEGRALLYVALIIVYIFLMKYIGFLFSSLLAVGASLLIMRDKKVSHYIIAIVLVALVWSSFKFLLNVPLP